MRFFKSAIFPLAALALWSCERPEIEGPALEELYGPFAVNENLVASETNADFSQGDVFFTADFARRVNWELHIEGQTSGGVKIIKGRSSSLDQTNAVWNGTTTLFPLLEAGEEVKCYLKITSLEEGESFTSDTVMMTIDQAVNYNRLGAVPIEDFNGQLNDSTTLESHGAWANPTLSFIGAFEGSSFLRISLATITWDYFIAGFVMKNDSANYFPIKKSNEQMYLNFALKGDANGDPNTEVIISIGEDDDGDGKNGRTWNATTGTYDPSTDDNRAYSFKMGDISEWTWMSIPYGSDDANTGFATDCGEGGCEGNGRIDINKITNITFTVIQDDLEAELNQVEVDMVYVSFGGPLEGY